MQLLRTVRLMGPWIASAPSKAKREVASLWAFLKSENSGGKAMLGYFVLAVLPALGNPLILRYSLQSLRLVEAATTLLAIVALVFLPSVRIWRSTGYHFYPPILVVIYAALGIVGYELTTRLYMEAFVQPDHVWMTRCAGVVWLHQPACPARFVCPCVPCMFTCVCARSLRPCVFPRLVSLGLQLFVMTYFVVDVWSVTPGIAHFSPLIVTGAVAAAAWYYISTLPLCLSARRFRRSYVFCGPSIPVHRCMCVACRQELQ